jgi:hypothetical protein
VERDDFETARAVHELLDALHDLDTKFFDGDAALTDEATVLEGYQWIFSILQVALDTNVWADKATPNFVDIVGRYKKWGGDNADAFYQYAPIDPARTYRVRGRRGDAVYLSLTVYGGPDDGHYSERIVGTFNDRQFPVADDGSFEFLVGPDVAPGEGIRLEPDAVAAITRDYLADPVGGVRATWSIESVDPQPDFRLDDAALARRFRAATTWVRDQAAIVPLAPGEPNTIDEPYPVPTTTFGWAAGDAAYAMGRFELADDQALVIEGTSPGCVFWNVCLWNPFLHTYNYDYDQVTRNGHQLGTPNGGPFTLVVSARDPGHPNWLATQGHAQGLLWFRWFLPDATPDRPTVRVVPIDEVGEVVSARP